MVRQGDMMILEGEKCREIYKMKGEKTQLEVEFKG